jgi:tetratricopeptide (TPR) repeat protein
MDKLRALLTDLGDGTDINEALVIHTESLGRLDADFANFARKRAESLAMKARWDEPELEPDAGDDALAIWLKQHSNSVPGLKQLARQQLRGKEFQQALDTAKQLRDIFPNDHSPDSAYAILAAACRGLNDAKAEREALEQLALRVDNSIDAHVRLIELAESKQDWEAVAKNAHRMLAVNPLVAGPHRSLARAAEKLGRRDEAIRAYQALLVFDTTDIAETHYRLASLLRDSDKPDAARRHVLMALEEAPRYLAAHRLLLDLKNPNSAVQDAPSKK